MVFISRSAYKKIKEYFVDLDAEQGGIIVSRNSLYYITDFIPDKTASVTASIYSPSETIRQRASVLEKENLIFCGIIHSHVKCSTKLSTGDREYIKQICKSNSAYPFFWFPVIRPCKNSMNLNITFNKCFLKNGELCCKAERFFVI